MIGFSQSHADLLEKVRTALPTGLPVYLVGGSVRDLLLERELHDLDFALAGDVLGIARRVANRLGAAYFPLDVDRQTARLVLTLPDERRIKLDFAALRGSDLESDLRGRDFTVNAMALPLGPEPSLVDPLGGASDLRARMLRACSESALADDPVRVIRSIRLATALNLKIHPETTRQVRQAASLLAGVSPERLRDELFRILEGPQPATAIRLLDLLGALEPILPEVVGLKGVIQSAPHISDVWTHTLELLSWLEQLLAVLAMHYDQEKAANWALGFISVQLGRFRQPLSNHLATSLNPDRSLRGLLFLAGLYHDVGKPGTHRAEATGRIRFFEHEEIGAGLVSDRAHWLRLNNDEVDRLAMIVRQHMRPMLLAQAGGNPSRRAIYRYFRATGPAGVDVGLLSLADSLATYGPTLPRETWASHLSVVRALLEAWWEHPEKNVAPLRLVDGNDLIQVFDLEPGPLIGQLLELIREAQATGHVNSRAQALSLAGKWLEGNRKSQGNSSLKTGM
ncbi:MAG: HD domain-containing protein [Anaerolineales bacterium]|nr:HD domain-containing protein [Anaerolineales bacterium]